MESCAAVRWLKCVKDEFDEIHESYLRGGESEPVVARFWPSVGYGKAEALRRAVVAEAGELLPILLPRIERLEAAHRGHAERPWDGDAIAEVWRAFFAVEDIVPAILAATDSEWTRPMTLTQLAKKFYRDKRTIQRWMASGDLPSRKVGSSFSIPVSWEPES